MTIVRTRTPVGEAIVILPEAEFERLRDLAEDTLDTRLMHALRAAPSPLAFWRMRRGEAAAALGNACGLSEGDVTALEAGACEVDMAVYRRLARALGINPEDLVPDAS